MSSKRHIRRKSCEGKVRYKDQAGAVGAIISMHKRYPLQPRMASYKCKFCKGWHIGHPNKQRRQSLRDKLSA